MLFFQAQHLNSVQIPTKAKEKLGWVPEHDLAYLVKDMMQSDIKLMQKQQYLKKGGYNTNNKID